MRAYEIIAENKRKKHKRKKNRTPRSITTGWWGGYFGSSESGDGGGVEESNKGVAEGSLNEIYKMPPTKNSSQGMAIWAYNDAVGKKSPILYKNNNVIVFKANENLLRYIALQDGNPVLYIGLSKFLDGYKSGAVATEIAGRGKGLAQKAYLNASDILGVPIYSDTTQTDASRLGIWNKLIQQYPDRIVGYDQKTNKNLPLTLSDKGPTVNQNQPIYVDRNEKYTNKPITPDQRYRTRILKLLPNKQGVAEEFTFNQPRKKLNIPLLIKRKAIFITHPHGPNGWETDKPEWDFSLITLQNVLEKSPSWTSEYKKYIRPESYSHATQQFFDKLSDQKYNQILWSIKKLGIPDNVAFLDNGKQGMSEDSYKESGSITHDGVEYDFDKVLATAETKPTKQCPVSKLKWVLAYDKPDISRLKNADISVPVVITKSNNGKLTVIDGLHRLAKAVNKNVNSLPVKYITNDELQSARLKQGVAEDDLSELDTRTLVNYVPKAGDSLKSLSPEKQKKRQNSMIRATRTVMRRPDGRDEMARYRSEREKEKGVAKGQENKMSAEEYKQKLLDNLPFMMKFLSQGVKGWTPSEQDMLDGIEIGYEKMKQTGDVKQAGAAMQQYLNTLHKKVVDTAKHMYEKYKGQSYTAQQRASDHAISYESNTRQFRYWSSVADEILKLEKETSK